MSERAIELNFHIILYYTSQQNKINLLDILLQALMVIFVFTYSNGKLKMPLVSLVMIIFKYI